jgi:hypothetical protein
MKLPTITIAFSATILTACSSSPQAMPWAASAPSAVLPAAQAGHLTYLKTPVTNSIQSSLISTFPTGIFRPKRGKGAFRIPTKPDTCGYASNSACNFYDGFGSSGNGKSIKIRAKVAKPLEAYTLMNAYSPAVNEQLATIEFVGSGGAKAKFPLIAGKDIRDFYDGSFADTLSNGVSGVVAKNVFQCVDPKSCLGGGGTGNVHTGETGKYRVDEQQYDLSALKGQTLTKIVLTDTYDGSSPILLGVTVESKP